MWAFALFWHSVKIMGMILGVVIMCLCIDILLPPGLRMILRCMGRACIKSYVIAKVHSNLVLEALQCITNLYLEPWTITLSPGVNSCEIIEECVKEGVFFMSNVDIPTVTYGGIISGSCHVSH